jgi:hypothetical protein
VDVLPVGAGCVAVGGGIGSGVNALHRAGGSAPRPWRLQLVGGFFAAPDWQGGQPDDWF